jgi:broad specificity phosphatase PhoE
VPLSAEGREQAEKVARALAGAGPAAVYASPLGRARETAEIIAKPHRLAVTADEAFKEMSFGVWEGLTAEEVRMAFADLYEAWRAAPHRVRFPGPGGEDLATVRARARAGIERLRAAHPGGSAVLVSHGIVVRLIVLDALGLAPERLWTVHAAPAGISEIEYRPGFATVHRMNTLSHLEPAREP